MESQEKPKQTPPKCGASHNQNILDFNVEGGEKGAPKEVIAVEEVGNSAEVIRDGILNQPPSH
jgi:hypothetical protein